MNDLLKSEKVDLALKSNNFIFYSRQISYVPSFDILASHQIDVDQSETRREGQSSQFLFINSYADYSDNFTFAGRFRKIFNLIWTLLKSPSLRLWIWNNKVLNELTTTFMQERWLCSIYYKQHNKCRATAYLNYL